jgi:hypothetical protein
VFLVDAGVETGVSAVSLSPVVMLSMTPREHVEQVWGPMVNLNGGRGDLSVKCHHF